VERKYMITQLTKVTDRTYKRYNLSAKELWRELIKAEKIKDVAGSKYQAITLIYEFTDLNERELSIMFDIDHSTINYAKRSIKKHCKNMSYNKLFEELKIRVREALNA
jgi:chromosomal replication initiation ATPase DnaA